MTPVEERDEDPSDEDLRRFGGDSARCPDCGAEVSDLADVCPRCFAYIGGDTEASTVRATAKRPWKSPWARLLLILIALALLGILGLIPLIR